MQKKKKAKSGNFNPEPLRGDQVVSPDGDWIVVDGRRFKRTVLPSSAELHRQREKLAADEEAALEALHRDDDLPFSEMGEAS